MPWELGNLCVSSQPHSDQELIVPDHQNLVLENVSEWFDHCRPFPY